jgi:hypothetical protein
MKNNPVCKELADFHPRIIYLFKDKHYADGMRGLPKAITILINSHPVPGHQNTYLVQDPVRAGRDVVSGGRRRLPYSAFEAPA